MFIDSHSHWSDRRILDLDLEPFLQMSFQNQISKFMFGGVDPEDWQRQIQLDQKYPETFYKCFGLHPYFVSLRSNTECESALDQLVMLLNDSIAIGETGLDFREITLKNESGDEFEVMSRQIEFFENQLQMAQTFNKPIVLHIVKAHEKALQVLDLFSHQTQKGFVHAFNGSFEVAQQYLKKGFYISVGGAVTFEKNHKLREAIKKIPLESLLLESDTPDQAPFGWVGLNNSSSLWQIAEVVAELTQLNTQEVMQISTNNFKKLFSL